MSGCRAGLLYRVRNDQAVAGLRSALTQRITAEKYVVAAYGLIVIAFFTCVMIHAAKISRLGRELEVLSNDLASKVRTET